MGYQDRDYYQEDHGPRGFAGSELSFTARIIIVNAAVFIANMFLSTVQHPNWLTLDVMSTHAYTLAKPWMWFQFLTYGFAHDPDVIGHVFWNMFGLFIFGPEVERVYGRWEYLRFYLAAVVLAGIAWGVRVAMSGGQSPPMLGASGAVTAVTLLYCMKFPTRTLLFMMVIPMPAWVLGVIIILGDVFQVGRANVAHDVHLAGAAFAWAYYFFNWNLGRIPGLDGLSRLLGKTTSLLKPGPKFKVHYGDDDAGNDRLVQEGERILVKISEQGESSLSKKERDVLERYSRLMRDKRSRR